MTGSVSTIARAASMSGTASTNRPRRPSTPSAGPARASVPAWARRPMLAKWPWNIASRAGPAGTGCPLLRNSTST
jgi:hypothetical protein